MHIGTYSDIYFVAENKHIIWMRQFIFETGVFIYSLNPPGFSLQII